jgi:hypothetical protein
VPGWAASRPAGDWDEESLNSQNHCEACVRPESSQVYLLVLPETFLETCYVQFCLRGYGRSSALANFVCPLLIVVQFWSNDHLRTQIRKELHIALSGWGSHSLHMSNYARFTAMSQASDSTKLLFTPFPDDMLDWGLWFQQHIKTSNTCTIRVKNGDDKWETISYLSLYIMGYRRKFEENLWAADVADIGKLGAAAILQHTPTATAEEKQFLLEDEKLFHFNNARVHRQMQVTLSTAIIEAVRDSALFSELDIFDQTIGPLDLYQGSRLLWKLTELCVSHLCRAKKTLFLEAMQIPSDIQANDQISKVEMHEQISRLDKFVMALKLGGDLQAEEELVEHFYEILHHHPRPIVTDIITAAEKRAKRLQSSARYFSNTCRLILPVRTLRPPIWPALLLPNRPSWSARARLCCLFSRLPDPVPSLWRLPALVEASHIRPSNKFPTSSG